MGAFADPVAAVAGLIGDTPFNKTLSAVHRGTGKFAGRKNPFAGLIPAADGRIIIDAQIGSHLAFFLASGKGGTAGFAGVVGIVKHGIEPLAVLVVHQTRLAHRGHIVGT